MSFNKIQQQKQTIMKKAEVKRKHSEAQGLQGGEVEGGAGQRGGEVTVLRDTKRRGATWSLAGQDWHKDRLPEETGRGKT